MNPIKKSLTYAHNVLNACIKRPSLRTIYSCVVDFPCWWKYLNSNHNSMDDEMPWITFAAIRFIKKHLKNGSTVYEFGSGGSTLFWANRAKEVISVEHDEAWYYHVQSILQKSGKQNTTYKWIRPQPDADFAQKSISNPMDYISDDENFKGMNFKEYVTSIDAYNDGYFDFVMVDGRSRTSCLYHALSNVRGGGYLILDNSEREYYTSEISELKDKTKWQRIDFFGPVPYISHFQQTTFFKKKI